MKVLQTKRSFRLEFKRQLRYAITAGIGFTVAFAWRESVFGFFDSLTSRILEVDPAHYLSKAYTSIVITLVGVLLIFISSKILRD